MPTGTSATSPRPDCTCHGEPAGWHKDPRYTAGGWWECRVKGSERSKRRYESLDGVAYNHLLMQQRRFKALHRRRQREIARG